MQIVIPGALPAISAAQSLMPYLVQRTPRLTQWFSRCSARVERVNILDAGCTAAELWMLTRTQAFAPAADQNVSSGLGPFLEPDTEHPQSAIWIAELVHVSPAQDGAALLTASQLDISQQESVSLFESAREVFLHYGFEIQAGQHPARWIATLPGHVFPNSTSPTLVANTRVNDWWPQDTASRPWRQLVNELQMTWHNHPINQARNETGLPAINSMWLYGGARTEQLNAAQDAPATRWHEDLLEPYQSGDWGLWLERLQHLEPIIINALNETSTSKPELVLMGEDRIVTLRPSTLTRLRAQVPGQATHWRNWWSPQN
ncbi:MAG: hypothetical protein CML16_03445 [Pusillimonas sp.]|nr:hypothetical protein [Pusillimonas sp.]MBC43642.1 hypothetical protein [Pusillimonas sp.]|tara:strand:- start:80224 stop:81174 length:951 start_codon:yes stop_codon:yes gene_type:complete